MKKLITERIIIDENENIHIRSEHKMPYFACKRLIDILVSGIACIVLFLPSLFIMLLIRLESEGAPIFRQERLGLGGRQFVIYKFRTMRTDAEENGPQFATHNDTRCTGIGSILRKLRIDEWPQFYNILIGDMSLVGPRPERPYFYQKFENSIPKFSQRLRVKPGLTGYAQTYGGLHLQPHEKIDYDLKYINDCNLWMDLKCFMKTFALLWKLMVRSDG